MAFGKRSNTSGQNQAKNLAAFDTQPRAIPAEAWETPLGDSLRSLGMGPDDASNLIPTPDSINARLDRDREKHQAKLAEINRDVAQKTGGGSVRPFFLIPDPCWNGETAVFLMMRLELFPYDDWNVVFLPADERTAAAMNAPMHPNGNIPAFVTAAEKFMRDAEAELMAAHAEAGRTHDFAAFAAAKKHAQTAVCTLAAIFAEKHTEAWKATR
jgi:hypothetical protein